MLLVWVAICTDTLAPSHSASATREAGAVAEEVERKNRGKYAHHFVPVAVEILAVFGPEARSFLQELAWPLHHGLHTGAAPTQLAKENCCGSPTGKHSCHSGVPQGKCKTLYSSSG